MSTNDYSVFIEKFAENHYIRKFSKKYKSKAWNVTLTAIREFLRHYDNIAPKHISNTAQLDIICPIDSWMIVKLDFKIAGSHISAKSSGNRLIAAVDSHKKTIRILLVYSKNEIGEPRETDKWRKVIAENYPEFKSLLK